MSTDNIFSGIPAELKDEFFDTLLEQESLKVERIVSRGHATPDGQWYDQTWDEWVIVLAGGAVLEVDGEPPQVLKPGDYLHLPAHVRHRVVSTSAEPETVWLAVHFQA